MTHPTVKRIVVSAILILALSLTAALGIIASLTATTEIYAEDVVVTPGSTSVTVPVKYRNNNVTAEAGLIKVGFDPTKLTYSGTTDSTGADTFDASVNGGEISVAFAGASVSSSSGTLFEVAFTLPSDFEDNVPITVTVENYGSTTGLVVTEYAEDVTATDGCVRVDATNLTSNGTDMPAKIALALTAAENDDVTITLDGVWTFTADSVYGSASSIPTHTITINGQNGAEIRTAGYMPSFCGNFVFNNIKFVGSASGGTTRWDGKNGLYFPENASCVIGTGCDGYASHTTTECGANLAGDSLTVNSGKFAIICAQMLQNVNTVAINDPKITVQGTAEAITVCGLGYNTANITGSADLTIGGSVNVTEFLAAGGYYSASSGLGGTLTVATTGDSTIRNICAVVGSSGVSTAGKFPQYTINVSSTATLTSTYGPSSAVINGNAGNMYFNTTFNIGDGLTCPNNVYFGVRPGAAANQAYAFKKYGNTVININGGTLASGVYGGSRCQADGSEEGSDIVLNINGGSLSNLTVGGSSLNGANTVHSGDIEYHLNKFSAWGNNKYGGSLIYGANAVQSGETTVYIGNPDYPALTVGSSMFAGGLINSSTGKVTGNSKLIVENVANMAGKLIGGAWINTKGGIFEADSELWIKSATTTGNVSNMMTGGCYAENLTGVPDDTDADDYITGGFGHVGNVKVVIDDGTFRSRYSFTSHGVNVKGNSTLIFNGGTFNEYSANGTWYRFSLLSDQAPAVDSGYNVTSQNTCSISGDLKVYFNGGAYNLGAFRFAELTASPNNTQGKVPHTGYGVVGGNTYMEIAGGTWSSNARPLVNNHGNTIGDCYLKFVGHNFSMSTQAQFYGINDWGQTWQTPVHGNYYLDLSLVDSEGYSRFISGTNTTITGNGSVFTAAYPALYDLDTLNITGNAPLSADPFTGGTLAATFNNKVDHSGGTLTDTYSRTWADVLKWDEYALNKTADAFEFNNTVSKLTTSLDVTVAGNDFVFPIDNPGVAEAETFTASNFDFLGLSIRTYDKALRARGYVTETLRNATIANNGFEVKSYGVLISKSVTAPLTLGTTSVKPAKAFEAGTDTDKYYIENGRFTFAAAIQNIPVANYGTGIYFRPYVELVDEAGVTYVIYPDYSTVQNFKAENGMNSYASLRDVAEYHKNHETAYYTSNKKVIDAIVG